MRTSSRSLKMQKNNSLQKVIKNLTIFENISERNFSGQNTCVRTMEKCYA